MIQQFLPSVAPEVWGIRGKPGETLADYPVGRVFCIGPYPYRVTANDGTIYLYAEPAYDSDEGDVVFAFRSGDVVDLDDLDD